MELRAEIWEIMFLRISNVIACQSASWYKSLGLLWQSDLLQLISSSQRDTRERWITPSAPKTRTRKKEISHDLVSNDRRGPPKYFLMNTVLKFKQFSLMSTICILAPPCLLYCYLS